MSQRPRRRHPRLARRTALRKFLRAAPPPERLFLVLVVSIAAVFYIYRQRWHEPSTLRWTIAKGRVSITPQEPVWLSGFASRTQPPSSNDTLDGIPLSARAAVIRKRGSGRFVAAATPLVLVTLDIVGIDRRLSDRIFEHAERRHGLGRDRLKLVVSHTHSGPVVGRNLEVLAPDRREEIDKIERYEQFLFERVSELIDGVLETSESASCDAFWGVAQNGMAVNRREIQERLYDGSHHGLIDPSVPVLHFRDAQGKVFVAIYGYAAHATILTHNNVYSGDYPGMTSAIVEKKHPGALAMFLPGAGGDQNVYPRGKHEDLARHALSLAVAVLEEIGSRKKLSGDRLDGVHTFVRLPFREERTVAEIAQRARSSDRNEAKASRIILRNWREQNGDARVRKNLRSYEYPLCLWRIGDIRMLFMGGEPTVEYALGFKPKGVDWVVGYSDDVMGYVGSKAVLREGKREGSDRAAIYYGLISAWKTDVEDIIYAAFEKLVRSGSNL